MKIAVIVQARMTSTRLPGKVLMDLAGKPVLQYLIDRLKYCQNIDEIVIAVSEGKENEPICRLVKANGLRCISGSEQDVLCRYFKAAKEVKADVIVRVTSDCPLIDPQIVDEVIEKHLGNGADYTSNVLIRSFPRGVDAEVLSFNALKKAHQEAKKDYDREHVTPFIINNPKIFKLSNVEAQGRLGRPDLRICIDTIEDLTLAREIANALGKKGKMFYLGEIIDLLDANPRLIKINQGIKQKESSDGESQINERSNC